MAGGDVTVGFVAEQLNGDHSEEGEKAIGQAAGAVQDTLDSCTLAGDPSRNLSATLLVPILICRLHEVIVALPSLKKTTYFCLVFFFFGMNRSLQLYITEKSFLGVLQII